MLQGLKNLIDRIYRCQTKIDSILIEVDQRNLWGNIKEVFRVNLQLYKSMHKCLQRDPHCSEMFQIMLEHLSKPDFEHAYMFYLMNQPLQNQIMSRYSLLHELFRDGCGLRENNCIILSFSLITPIQVSIRRVCALLIRLIYIKLENHPVPDVDSASSQQMSQQKQI